MKLTAAGAAPGAAEAGTETAAGLMAGAADMEEAVAVVDTAAVADHRMEGVEVAGSMTGVDGVVAGAAEGGTVNMATRAASCGQWTGPESGFRTSRRISTSRRRV